MLQCLSEEKVSFLLVGAYALAAYGYLRATMDMDIWVMPSPDNAAAVMRALKVFGTPVHDLTFEDLEKNDTIFQIGVAPRRIDIITGISGLVFEEAWRNSVVFDIEGISVRIPSVSDLIINKKSTGRLKDLADVEILETISLKRENSKS